MSGDHDSDHSHEHSHDHGHDHSHAHDHSHTHGAECGCAAPAEGKPLTPAAQRALAEAAARRAEAEAHAVAREKELNGPKGPEPTRYGDWERKGIASDF